MFSYDAIKLYVMDMIKEQVNFFGPLKHSLDKVKSYVANHAMKRDWIIY